MPQCDRCPELAVRGTYNLVEIPRAPGDWREFRNAGRILNGCAKHPPESYVTYIDGRVIRTAQQVPERVPEAGR